MTATPADLSSVNVTEMSAAEWKDTVRRALARLGVTYQQLAEQARRREFASVEARKLWVAIGEQAE